MLILVDEIFKGTNSADRITGAQEIITRLNRKHIIIFVSTHDLELCKLIDDHEIRGAFLCLRIQNSMTNNERSKLSLFIINNS